MNEVPILYSFRRCPYAIRARFALLHCGTTVILREVLLREKPAELLTISPKATVPVLQLPDGRVIEESLQIIEWALLQNDPDGWNTRNDRDLINENDISFKQALDSYKYPGRTEPIDPLAARATGLGFLDRLNRRLEREGFLSGCRLGVTDVAIFPFVRQFAAVDRQWFDDQQLPALQKWLADIVTTHAFERVMHRYQRWRPGDQPMTFPI